MPVPSGVEVPPTRLSSAVSRLGERRRRSPRSARQEDRDRPGIAPVGIVKVARVKAGAVVFGGPALPIIAGPCVIESDESCIRHAVRIAEITRKVGLPFVFKCSFDKANRTSYASFRGPGLEKGLKILARVKSEIGAPILTDIHEVAQ